MAPRLRLPGTGLAEAVTRGSLAAVVLAAGEGRRFTEAGGGGSKLCARLSDGRSVIGAAVQAALAADLDETIVVTGATPADALDLPSGVTALHCATWRSGQAASLQTAVAHARDAGHSAIVVALGDQPAITVDAWRAVAYASVGPIVRAGYSTGPGHPVRFDQETWAVLPVTGDEVGRAVFAAHPEWVHVVACDGSDADVDLPSDLG